jgi:cysteinyl-tRNA synthetase
MVCLRTASQLREVKRNLNELRHFRQQGWQMKISLANKIDNFLKEDFTMPAVMDLLDTIEKSLQDSSSVIVRPLRPIEELKEEIRQIINVDKDTLQRLENSKCELKEKEEIIRALRAERENIIVKGKEFQKSYSKALSEIPSRESDLMKLTQRSESMAAAVEQRREEAKALRQKIQARKDTVSKLVSKNA